MNFKPDNKGISLALTIGLLLLLVTVTTTLNELVIRALRASHQIEASDRAYFAAEAGMENALYELSIHTAGYETDPLGSGGVRNDVFSDPSVKWVNEWEIDNKGLNDCSNDWESFYAPEYCGRIYEGEKLVINIFSDDASSGSIPTNQIGDVPINISSLDVSAITIKFRLPLDVVASNPDAWDGSLDPLYIDNDGDYNIDTGEFLNEERRQIFWMY